MHHKVLIHVPEASANFLLNLLKTGFGKQVEIHAEAPAPLRLDTLSCFNIRFKGSVMHSRAPFVYPLLSGELHRYYLTSSGRQLSEVHGADWIYLGGSDRQFVQTLGRYMLLNKVRHVHVRPFTSVEGELARSRQPGDTDVIMCKQPCYHNDKCVKKVKDTLLTTPPDKWDRNDYVLVSDRYESIRPLIEKHLPAPPRVIVEIGCGLGNTTARLAEEFPDAQVTGYDFSEHSIEVARRSFNLPNLHYEVGDFTRPLPIDDKSVDLLVSIEATNMSAAPTVTASEFCRIVSDRGVVVNASLSESSYIYWDYPASLFFPTHMNTFATDWFFTVKAAGYGFHLEPWSLFSFTFIPCRDEAFHNAHRSFLSSRMNEEDFQPYHDRFAMVFGPGVAGLKPTGVNAHIKESNYLDYVALCLKSHDSTDAELERFTRWGIDLVRNQLLLLPEADQFIMRVLPETRNFPFYAAEEERRKCHEY